MKKLRLKETCTQYTVTRNRYGDLVLTQVGSLLCLFRDISTLDRNINYREEVSINGLFWFDPSATVSEGDVVGIYGDLYRLTKVTLARDRLLRDTLQFIKCEATLYRAIS